MSFLVVLISPGVFSLMRIGNIDIDCPLCLAPMEDISDYPFRLICREQGADLLYTEFASCEALVRDVPRTVDKIAVRAAERPIAVQIYGSNPESMKAAAGIAETYGADWVDINCGCWVKKIANRGDGAGLLRDLPKMRAAVAAVIEGTSLPVTVKTRLGWDADSIVITEVAPMLEDLGVAALALHCRTREQGYKGAADWRWLEKVKAVSGIPLIANGDIETPDHARQCIDLGADGIMIGRGAITSPWVFRRIRHYLDTGETLPEPDIEARFAMCIRHLRAQAEYRGERRGVITFRKHYSQYLKGFPHIAHLRAQLMEFEEAAPVAELMNRYLEAYLREESVEAQ
jgi:tRNA-dihydrouridine synthase B